jgi:hypothetical protein
MIAKITLAKRESQAVLLACCYEPLTKCIPAVPPYDRTILKRAIAARPGAAMRLISRRYIPSPADFGDEEYVYELEITDANVLALRATTFGWSDEAENAATAVRKRAFVDEPG